MRKHSHTQLPEKGDTQRITSAVTWLVCDMTSEKKKKGMILGSNVEIKKLG